MDLHEEPFALATAEILALRWLRTRLPGRRRRPAPPYVLYSAQNIPKRYPWPFRAFEARRAAWGGGGIGVQRCRGAYRAHQGCARPRGGGPAGRGPDGLRPRPRPVPTTPRRSRHRVGRGAGRPARSVSAMRAARPHKGSTCCSRPSRGRTTAPDSRRRRPRRAGAPPTRPGARRPGPVRRPARR
ncbi:hypothetical protein NKG05_19690 [Oerskovia sp. M15]